MTLLRLFLFACLLHLTTAHESCCKHKLKQQQLVSEFIEDLDDIAPPEYQGQPRLLANPTDVRPDDWEDEDDGEWKPVMLDNPYYAWKRQLIPNPNYIPPPTYWDKLSTELMAAIPWVTLGVLVTGLLSILSLPLGTLKDWLSHGTSGPVSAISAALLGLATPLCSCGALPLAAGLVSQGVPLSAVLTFLTASQSAGLDSAAITWGLLGPTALFCRLGGAIVLAIAVGMVCPRSNVTTEASSSTAKDATCLPPKSQPNLIATLLETATDIYPTVLAGLALSTAALHFLPSLIHFENGAAPNSFLVRLSILGSAIPLQLCEHTTVTLAAAVQKAGGSPGLAFAFLLSAPATNLPSLLLLMQHGAGIPTVLRVLLALSTTSLALSYLVDAAGVDLLAGHEAGDMATLPAWYTTASPYLAGGLCVAGMIKSRFLVGTTKKHADSDDCCSDKRKKD